MPWHRIGEVVLWAWVALVIVGVAIGIRREQGWRRQGWRPVRYAALGRKVWARSGRDVERKP